jgi:hypothetical protein
MWLKTHRIPLCVLDRYLSAFYPQAPRNEIAAKRFPSYFSPAGSFRLFVRDEDCKNRDLLRLLRHKLRFPDFSISFESLSPGPEANYDQVITPLWDLDTPEWRRKLRGRDMRQIRITDTGRGKGVHIVVSEKASEPFMKDYMWKPVPEEYLDRVGLGALRESGLNARGDWHQRVSFGISYS